MDPREILPHRPPFLFLDQIEELGGASARARYRFKPDEWFFAGHFPGNPVVPGVIQVEAMGQLVVAMGLTAARELKLEVDQIWFSMVNDCRFHRPLGPGDEVIVRAEREWLRLKTIQARGTLHHAATGELVCEATLRGASPR
jgi:3-hydroxyacyl-[acyl-carrier-protein] dehydratase